MQVIGRDENERTIPYRRRARTLADLRLRLSAYVVGEPAIRSRIAAPAWKSLLRIVSIAMLAGGCTPFADKMDSWVGHPIAPYLDLTNRGRGDTLEEVQGPDALGNKTYVFRVDKNCRFAWLVDSSGIIRSWTSEGSSCKYYTQ